MDSKMNYFIEQTNKRLEEIDHKLDQLISFRMLLIGASAGLSLITTVFFNLALLWATKGG